MWATDYPHADGFPDAADMVKRMGLPAQTLVNVLAGGAKRYYNLQWHCRGSRSSGESVPQQVRAGDAGSGFCRHAGENYRWPRCRTPSAASVAMRSGE
jgi:hypothetical protein